MKSHKVKPYTVKSYREAGVDIKKADEFVNFIKGIHSPTVGGGIGAFSSGFEGDLEKYKNPVVLATTDGVGTKILIAKELGNFKTIGIDLVAMSVNDLLASGAEPYSFYDYIASGKLDIRILKDIIAGIIRGCEAGTCRLAGGETAELPDMYETGDIDLAGFAVGLVEKDKKLPNLQEMKHGDIVLGIPSSGIHSNGLSLARKVIPESEHKIREMLLTPTRIYSREMKVIMSAGVLLGAAHITGGGLAANIERIIPETLKLSLNFKWEIPEIFKLIKQHGAINDEEMYRVFNMGIGFALVCHSRDLTLLERVSENNKLGLKVIGKLENV